MDSNGTASTRIYELIEPTITVKTLYGCKGMGRYYKLLDTYSKEEWVVDVDNSYGTFERIKIVKGEPYFIFKSTKGKSYSFNADKWDDLTYNNGLIIGKLPLFKKSDAIINIKKFGLVRWKQILNADVKIGMTKEMVLLSIGQPNQTTTDTSVTSITDIWDYGYMNVHFRNGKVFSITEF